jgi:hypothetical protein
MLLDEPEVAGEAGVELVDGLEAGAGLARLVNLLCPMAHHLYVE